MFCGLDFGTSNCSLGLWRDGAPVLAGVGRNGPYMPSVAYAERGELNALPIDEGQLRTRIAAALRTERTRRTEAKRRNRRYAGLSESEIASRERNLMQRESARATADAFSRQTIATALQGSGRLLFGEDAIDANALTPMDGFYFKSPKLFLGSEVQDTHLDVFSQVITAMIAEVRQRAEIEAGHAITQTAIGHPVVYSLSRELAGNGQALEIMERCARKAGFADIVFLPEPLAAAFNYERTVTHEEIVLVVDVGGGTTDCAVVRVGPRRASVADRASDVLAYAGDRVGGGMMDFHLAWRALMPSFGKDSLLRSGRPVPHPILIDAISVENVPRQERFRRAGVQIRDLVDNAAEPDKLERLLQLWQEMLQHRLVRSAEAAKIGLSQAPEVALPLDYIDPELQVRITGDELRSALESDLARITALACEAAAGAGAPIDRVFLTGGASKSPVVLEAIRTRLGPAMPIVRGDDFGSVTEGLTRYACDVFGASAR